MLATLTKEPFNQPGWLYELKWDGFRAIAEVQRIKYSDHAQEQGVGLYRLALENGLEGVIAKDSSSPYRQGVRSTEWLKFKTHNRQKAVIGGFTEPKGSRPELGALLLCVYEGKDLVYVGHTGGGFSDADLAEMRSRLIWQAS